jgi:CheY-like chemotaxis protein
MLEDNPVRRYQVVSAGSGMEGLAMMRQYSPDLVLLDLMMPDIDGFEFIERARSTSEWHDIPIVVVSAQDEVDDSVTLAGFVSMSRTNGLAPSDIVKWVQCVVNGIGVSS